MVKYFQLRGSSNPKVIGVRDGGVQAEMIDKKWSKEELDRYTNDYLFGIWDIVPKLRNGEPVRPPKLEYIRLKKGAILTDFLSFSEPYAGGDYLVSSRLQELLKDYNIDCRFYEDIGLYQSETLISGYANFHLIPLESKRFIDFSQSVCYAGSELVGKSYYYPKSEQEYYDMFRKNLIFFDSIAVDGAAVRNLDMFSFDVAIPSIFISSRLKDALVTKEITGVNIIESKEPSIMLI